jgi:hypothetical protein
MSIHLSYLSYAYSIAAEYNRKSLSDGKLPVTDAQPIPVKIGRRTNIEAII